MPAAGARRARADGARRRGRPSRARDRRALCGSCRPPPQRLCARSGATFAQSSASGVSTQFGPLDERVRAPRTPRPASPRAPARAWSCRSRSPSTRLMIRRGLTLAVASTGEAYLDANTEPTLSPPGARADLLRQPRLGKAGHDRPRRRCRSCLLGAYATGSPAEPGSRRTKDRNVGATGGVQCSGVAPPLPVLSRREPGSAGLPRGVGPVSAEQPQSVSLFHKRPPAFSRRGSGGSRRGRRAR